jgi:lysophospholipase L1-like esterase
MRQWPRLKRWLAFTSFVLVTTAALIELLLQAGAYAVYLANRKDVVPFTRAERTVLCVGDSWTHGMGTSDAAVHSYPAVLQSLLCDRTNQQWSVINGGQSGQNSRDVLIRLASQIDAGKPKVVCVLVARNDQWSNPDEVPRGEGEQPFATYRFRWRLPRLLAWTKDSLFPPPVFIPVRKEGEAWAIKTASWPASPKGTTYPVGMSSAGTNAKQLGWKLDAEGSATLALEQFRITHAEAPEDPQTRAMLAVLTLKCGMSEESELHASWLKQKFDQSPDYFYGRALLDYFSFAGKADDQFKLAKQLLLLFPEDPLLWYQRGEAEFRLGLKLEAKASLQQCVQRWDYAPAYTMLFKVAMYDDRDPVAAADTILRAYIATNDHSAAASMLGTMLEAKNLDGGVLLAQADALVCGLDVKDRIRALIAEALHRRDGKSAERVLLVHLKRIADLVRSKGAVPVFLDYPIMAPLQHCLRESAYDDAVAFIDVKAMWEARVPEARRAQLRSPDGHVNDEGYRIMAECVADGLMPILQTLK